ncbi:hypothetical protein AB0D66_30385 [Streptomyces sp. NPDC048270]|uniref:hypothetical protein n=1 Tax=Streptomyces sp. NPDC048270 TaxID=3154615 RepID=UPI003405123A
MSLPMWVNEYWTELSRNRQLSRAIDRALAAGDVEALSVFRTRTLAATFTVGGRCARMDELVRYAALVVASDGCAYRYHRLLSEPEHSP